MTMLRELLTLCRPHWSWLVLSIVVGLATLLANIALMAMSGWFIAAMAVAGAAGTSLNYFTPAAIIRACAILRTGGRYVERLVGHETTFRLLARLRVWLYGRLEPQSPDRLALWHGADVATRLRADVDRLETAYLRVSSPLMVGAAAAVVVVWFLARFDPVLASVEAGCMLSAALVLPLALVRLSARHGRDRVRLSSALTEAAVDAVQGMGELVVFVGAVSHFRQRFLATSNRLIHAQTRLGNLTALGQAGMLLAANLALWCVVVVAIPLVRGGSLDSADFVMVALVALAGFEAVAPIPAALFTLGAVGEAARRLFALAAGRSDGPAGGILCHVPERCDLVATGMCFRYGDDGPAVLRDVAFSLPQGGRMALLGPVGSGKSTLVGVLTGLRRPSGGAITLGGHGIEEYEPETLRRCFSVASQDAALFTGTIRSNLLLAAPQAPEEALWRALAVAQLDGFVQDLAEGLETSVGEAGLTLSGGQARRLVVARAWLRDAPVLVLDEPGEGLDTATERALLTAVVANLGRRSLILITHRKVGVELMDQSLRLDQMR